MNVDPFVNIPFGGMTNGRYGVLAYVYTFGQLRLKITDSEVSDSDAPIGHGAIVREA